MKRIICAVALLMLAGGPALWGAYTWSTSLDITAANTWDPGTQTYQYPNFRAESTSQASNGLAGGYLMYNVQYPYSQHAVNMVLTGTNGLFAEVLGANFPQAGDTAPTGSYMEVDVNGFNEVHVYSVVGSTKTQFAWASFTGHSNVAIKSIWNGTAGSPVLVYIDNVLVMSVTAPISASSSGTGIGVLASNDVIKHVDIGPWDSVSPNGVPSGSIGISTFVNHVDLQWPAATDDANGMGVLEYQVLRNGLVLGTTTALTYSDTTVVPDTNYSYDLRVLDDFLNPADTVFSARTQVINSNPPYPSSTPEGRRVGVRSTGAYWGASPENIDVRSGNLSFSVPILTAQSRAGLSAGFGLSYNSQNWRNDSGGNWKFDGDVGYGFGWRFLAGSITPVWNSGGLTAAYFLFMDSTGAEYRLDQSNNNVWSSKDSIYVYFDANTNILHFRNGNYWYFGCISASTEADAGVMYPTLMQDAHPNNKITITYKQSSGGGWINSSARIATITDVRAISPNPTYSFTYNTDAIPHLISTTNSISSGEGFGGTYLQNQALASPFDGQSFGTTALASTFITLSGTYSFTHNGSGELTRITLPYGGYLAYDYTTMTYSSSRSYREVIRRYLSKDGSTQTTYPFSHEPNPGPDVHSYTILDDPGGVGEKYWGFSTSGTYEGLVTQYQGRQLPGPVTKTQNDFTWAQDATNNSYISSTLTTADPGQSYQIQKKTTQTLDTNGYGNVTQVQNFDWGNLTTPAKTYTYTYMTGTGTGIYVIGNPSHTYISDFIMNRLLTAKVSDGTHLVTLANNYYDNYAGLYYNYGLGDLTVSTTLAGTSTIYYDAYGNVRSTTNPQAVTTTLTYPNSGNNQNAAPTQITVGSFNESLSYNSFLGLTGQTGPNLDSTSVTYANISQPSQTISPFGAQTNYTYGVSPNPSTTTAVVNGRWTRTTTDGLHRTIKVESGVGSTYTPPAISQTDTVYDSCGCSPLGKLKQVSLPHAPSAGAVWTTYTYDGIGRTLSVQAPDGASTTAYSYQGNVVTVTDPAGAWKKYTSDAFGRLTNVEEPNPAGGSYFTIYTYDVLDHLTGVSMPRPTGTQTRTFVYNSGPFLLSATNPENGTVSYGYDSSNRLSTVTDAKGQKKVMTYDSLSRVTQVQRYITQSGSYVEDPMQRTNYTYDSGTYGLGRLTGVQYYGGNCTNFNGLSSGCDLINETYTYTQPGAMASKKVQVTRSSVNGSLTTSWTYDNEGRATSVTYPGWKSCSSCSTIPGSSYTYAYDTMGRMNTMTDTVNTRTLVSGVTYGVANEVQQMTSGYTAGVSTESRTYNGMFQLTQLTVGSALSIQYAYSATQNNGKITSQTDTISGEQVVYTYDALNRLATAQTMQTGGTQWGQSYTYDGFGNLTDQNVIKGSAPTMHVVYNAANNRQSGENADFNGNLAGTSPYAPFQNQYDVENRLIHPGSDYPSQTYYAYDANNKRVWRGDANGTPIIDELTFWAGQKLATYQLSNDSSKVYFTLTSTNVYFGGKLISKGTYNSSGTGDKVTLAPVAADRLGSIGKFYPYGVERPSATANDKEKFTGYFRDTSTGLDYADQRYEQPGMGRFMTPDPYGGSAKMGSPGSWNRYAYVGGDPVNHTDPRGLQEGFITCVDGSNAGDPPIGAADCAGLNLFGGGGTTWSWGIPNDWNAWATGLVQSYGMQVARTALQGVASTTFSQECTSLIDNAFGAGALELAQETASHIANETGGVQDAAYITTPAGTALFPNDPVLAANQQERADKTTGISGVTLAQFADKSTGTLAWGSYNGDFIYINNPSYWAGYGSAFAFYTMLHELLHVSGLGGDLQIENAFGLPTDKGSSVITYKLMEVCGGQ